MHQSWDNQNRPGDRSSEEKIQRTDSDPNWRLSPRSDEPIKGNFNGENDLEDEDLDLIEEEPSSLCIFLRYTATHLRLPIIVLPFLVLCSLLKVAVQCGGGGSVGGGSVVIADFKWMIFFDYGLVQGCGVATLLWLVWENLISDGGSDFYDRGRGYYRGRKKEGERWKVFRILIVENLLIA